MAKVKPYPSLQTLHELFSYDTETGVLRWRNHGKYDRAGSPGPKGYRVVKIDGALFREHRIIFKMMTGQEPAQIDHENGDRTDNRWTNLRPASAVENGRNRRINRNNSSGHTGVFWSRQYSKWIAKIKVNYREIHLGTFDDINDAVAARKAADIKYGFHPNHGKEVGADA